MSVVTLSFIPSESEISSGIPREITIESNTPATIFFTLDGTTPTEDSPIYVGTITLPSGKNSVTLKAFGVDSEGDAGPILSETFAPDTTDITVTRLTGLEGLIIDDFNDLTDFVVGYNADGDPSGFQDFTDEELDIIYSEPNPFTMQDGTAIEVQVPLPQDTSYPFDDDFETNSNPSIPELFNPRAKTITIDQKNNKNPLNIIPRHYGSLRDVHRENEGHRLYDPEATYISGGFVRRFYSAKTNTMVSYYFDHNTGRQVKNIQELPDNIAKTSPANPGYSGNPLIFKWISGGRQQTV